MLVSFCPPPQKKKWLGEHEKWTWFVVATKCFNPKGSKEKTAWFIPNGDKACRRIESVADDEVLNNDVTADNVVFAVQMPLRKMNTELDFSRCR